MAISNHSHAVMRQQPKKQVSVLEVHFRLNWVQLQPWSLSEKSGLGE